MANLSAASGDGEGEAGGGERGCGRVEKSKKSLARVGKGNRLGARLRKGRNGAKGCRRTGVERRKVGFGNEP